MASRRFFDGAQSELGLLPVGTGDIAGLTFTDPTLFNEPFTGTNGAAWDSDWTEVYNGSTTVTIQGNKGRMAVPTADGAIYYADTVTLPTDYEIRVAIVGSADRDARVYFGTEFMTGGFSGNGHFVKLDSSADTLTLGTVVGYTDSTPVGSTTYTHAGTDTTYLHIKVRGTSCKIRAWKNSEDEPLSWQLTGTLTYTFDELHLGAFGVGSTCNVDFDDLYVWTTRPLAVGTDTSWAGSGDLVVLKHSHPTWTGDVKAIIWKHGGIGGAANNVDDWTLYPELIADGNGRFILYAADDGFGGNGAAGNDTELASLDAVYARAQTDYPEFPKVALAAHSLGGMGIVNWAYRNTSDVAGMIGVDVILDAAQMETDTGDFILNVLDPAYGGSGTWATNASTRDPQDLATASSALRAIPFEIYDATGDSVLTSTVMSNYVTAHGANATRTTIASGDHGTVHNFIDVDTLITEIQTWDFTAPAGTTVTPTVVTGSFSVPAPTVTSSATVAVTTVTATFAVAAPTVTAGATVATTAVTAAFSVQAPTVTTTATVATTTVTAAFSVQAPTVTAATTVTTTTVTGLFEVPAPTVSTGASATATPATVTVAASVPAPTVTASATVATTTVTALFSVGTPTVLTGTVVTTTTVTAAFQVGTVTPTAAATITTTTVTGLFSVPAPSVSTASGATPTPTTVTALFSVGTNTPTTTATITATAVVATFTVPAPTVSAGAGQAITTTTVLAAFAVAAPTATAALELPTTTVTAPFTVGSPTLAIGAGVAGATVTARFLVGATAIVAEVLVQIATVRRRYATNNRRTYTVDNRERYRGNNARTYKFKG